MHAQATQVFADWLVSEGPRTAGVPGLIVGVAEQLNAFGFGIIRISIMLRTLHPEIESIRFGWIAEHSDIPPIGQPFFLKKRITPVGKETVEEISFSHGAFARSAPYQVSPYKRLELGENEVLEPSPAPPPQALNKAPDIRITPNLTGDKKRGCMCLSFAP